MTISESSSCLSDIFVTVACVTWLIILLKYICYETVHAVIFVSVSFAARLSAHLVYRHNDCEAHRPMR